MDKHEVEFKIKVLNNWANKPALFVNSVGHKLLPEKEEILSIALI